MTPYIFMAVWVSASTRLMERIGETLMPAADTGMSHAKEKGRSNFQFLTPALNKAVPQRFVMENSLRQAWAEDRLTLHYQPQVDMTSGAIISCEVLLRWQQPSGKAPISYGGFIAIAEETGLIVPIVEWALRQAYKQLRCWYDRGYSDLWIATCGLLLTCLRANSIKQIFPDKVAQILEEAGLAASDLDLKITESLLPHCNNDNIATFWQLSVLRYLQHYPINALKIGMTSWAKNGSSLLMI